MGFGRLIRAGLACAALAGLVACDTVANWPTKQAPKTSARPELRPDRPKAPAPAPAPVAAPSAESRALAEYYKRVENDLVARGLLRVDGGGIDTPYSEVDVIRNFERIAFYDEYARGGGLQRSDGSPSRLKRWTGPIRIKTEFGALVPPSQRSADNAEVARYAARLARVTGHPISTTSGADANFHVFFVSEDDRASMPARIRQIVPNINPTAMALFRELPRSIHCFVIAFSTSNEGYNYAHAIALIRAEHPSLLRRSCIHEEIAQGLGLANDSPRARPSIFNDDDEFALLTTHDEELLRMLYNPRLRPGMSLDEARPIYSGLASRQLGQAL